MMYLTREAFEKMTRSLLHEANMQLHQFYKAFGTEQANMIKTFGWFTFAELCEEVKFTEGTINPQFSDDMLMDIRFVFYQSDDKIRKYIYSYGDFELLRGLSENDYDFYRGFLEYDKYQGIYSGLIENW